MGCVAWGEIEEPPLALVRCVRRDLALPSSVYDHPLWQGTSSDNQYWKAGIWQVHKGAGGAGRQGEMGPGGKMVVSRKGGR